MKRRTIMMLATAMLATLLCSCSSPAPGSSIPDTVVPVTVSDATADEPYIHGEDGYFNLADKGIDIDMRLQDGGTCWLYSAAASMETAYALNTDKEISIDPLDMLDAVYGDDKTEGFFVRKGVDKKELGGWAWMLTETLSNGFGSYALDNAIALPENDNERLKETVMEFGAVTVGIPDVDSTKKGVFYGYRTINHVTDEDSDYDHNVAIIGWDDNFPKEYFRDEPSQDGAWIAYNSLHNLDYYYISYDTALRTPVALSVTDKYPEILSYDCGNESDAVIRTGSETTAANVFHHPGMLTAVGTYSSTENQEITIEIFSSDFADLLYTQEALLSGKGYHTVELDSPIEVTDYAIAVRYSNGAPVEGETWGDDYLTYSPVSESGQSFVLINGRWEDITDESVIAQLGIDFTPNNCCIKALYS